jgi:hypothetical protein
MPPRSKGSFPGAARTIHAQPQDRWVGRFTATLRKTSIATLLQIFGAFAGEPNFRLDMRLACTASSEPHEFIALFCQLLRLLCSCGE